MRNLRFRAWVNDHWRDWLPTIKTLGLYNEVLIDEDDYSTDSECYIEQYTGVRDKNGKRIFEGDIVRIMGFGTYEVFWRSWDSSFSLKAIDTDIEEHTMLMLCEGWEGNYTIIGNIHENGDLLKGVK